MTPKSTLPTGVLFENDVVGSHEPSNPALHNKPPNKYVRKLKWGMIVYFTALHIGGLYGFFLMFTSAKIATSIFAFFLFVCGTFGISAGVHRLWSHKAYKAKLPLRILLMIFNTLAFQNSIWTWTRDHRIHHKYSETDADPVNAKRGFFFSHVGWLCCNKHPDIKDKGQGIDLSDIEADPVVAFQKKYYKYLVPILCFYLPTMVPMYFWGESFKNAFFLPTIFRYIFSLNMTWFVNSAAHLWGNKPYDKNINPSENFLVVLGTLGEGFHNYHHVFPWDYTTSELGTYDLNWTTAFIDFFAKIGWAYNLKRVSPEIINLRRLRSGDGSNGIWGWGDKDQPAEERESAIIEHRKKN